jgi:hypothetical protein
MGNKELFNHYCSRFEKAFNRLQAIYSELKDEPAPDEDSEEPRLQKWESLSSRFARSSEIFLSKLVKFYVQHKDPAFRGSMIDYINEGAKLGIIQDGQAWKRIRELRNMAAHEYSDLDLRQMYEELKSLCPVILGVNIATFRL